MRAISFDKHFLTRNKHPPPAIASAKDGVGAGRGPCGLRNSELGPLPAAVYTSISKLVSRAFLFFHFTKKKKEPREGPFPKKEKILSGIRNLNPIRRGAMMEIDRIYLSTIPTFTNITKVQRDFKTFL